MKCCLLCVFCAFLVVSGVRAAQLPPGFVESRLADGLDPTDLVVAPDGRLFVTIKSGKILVFENGQLLPDPFLDIEAQVDGFNERGLGHMVLDPGFAGNGRFYVYYTVKDANRNRLSAFTAVGNFTLPGTEEILLDLDPLAGTIHNGGAMVFGNDGKLYVGVGDGADAATAQSPGTLLGKILRLNADGSIPGDNPFYADPAFAGNSRAIWSLGVRNPFTMAVNPVSGRIYFNDVGGSDYEEVNELLKGKNYGWPLVEGRGQGQNIPANHQDPVYAYPHGAGAGAGCAVVGAAFYALENYPPLAFPTAFRGRYFFADYCNGYIRMIEPTTAGDGTLEQTIFATGVNRPLAIRVGSDGALYYLAREGLGGGSEADNTSSANGSLWKVSYNGSGAPVVSIQPEPLIVPIGEDARFSMQAAGDPPLQYQWQANGADIIGANATVFNLVNAQPADDGKVFRCKVTNAFGSVFSDEAMLTVTANNRPQDPVISYALPGGADVYQAGQSLTLSGSAIDPEDGALPAAALSWKIDFHHDEHSHPGLAWTTGLANLEYAIPSVGETADNVWLRVYLRATDSEGLSRTAFVDIFPEKAAVTINTVPPGLEVKLDGKTYTAPVTFTSVVGQLRSLEAVASVQADDELLLFDGWSTDGAGRQFYYTVAPGPNSVTATYASTWLGDGTGLRGYYYSNQLKTFEGQPDLIRTDPVIDFQWQGASPAPSVSAENFTVRWLGEVMPLFDETVTFHVLADDGARLWVNDELLIDAWVDQPATEYAASIDLLAQQKYPVKLEYYDNQFDATIRLMWSSDRLPKQVIPARQLSADFVTGVPAGWENILKLYPTRAIDHVQVEWGSPAPRQWTIHNLLGQQMAGGQSSSAVRITVADWKAGIYVFRILGEGVPAIRFVKL